MHWVLWVPYYYFSFIIRLILWHFPQSTPFHNYQNVQENTQHYRLTPLFKTEAPGMKEGQISGRWLRLRVTLPCSGRNHIIPLMRRQNTDITPNKPVTWPRNQLLIRYAVTSPVHTNDTGLRYAVTLQVWAQLKSRVVFFLGGGWRDRKVPFSHVYRRLRSLDGRVNWWKLLHLAPCKHNRSCVGDRLTRMPTVWIHGHEHPAKLPDFSC